MIDLIAPETRRALELDALSAILPIDRRDRLAGLLTDDDVDTLKHLAREGMGENTLKALASDLAYLEAWALAATGRTLPWPATEALLLKFVAHHLWDPARREADDRHGMPANVTEALRADGLLRTEGPHAPATVRRGNGLPELGDAPSLARHRGAIRLPCPTFGDLPAVRASDRPRQRKSQRAVTREIFGAAGGDLPVRPAGRSSGPRDPDGRLCIWRRDDAARSLAFGSNSSVTSLRSYPILPIGFDAPALPFAFTGRTKTASADDDAKVLMVGPPVVALKAWIERARIAKRSIFRAIDRWGTVEARALTPQSVNLILKRRCAAAGLDPQEFSGAWAALRA